MLRIHEVLKTVVTNIQSTASGVVLAIFMPKRAHAYCWQIMGSRRLIRK